jgi:RND family efflux transporter MFP subunit
METIPMPETRTLVHKMSKHSRIYLSVSAVLLGLGASACSGETPVAAEEAAPSDQALAVAVKSAESVVVPNVLELDGTLRAKRRAQVSPLVAGNVARVLVERGDVVEEGQILMELRATDYRLEAQAAAARATAQLEQLGVSAESARSLDPEDVPSVVAAKADWEALHDQLERNEQLHGMGAVAEQALTQSRAAEAAARARYEAARQGVAASLASYSALSADAARRRDDASNSKIRAPFAGSVVSRAAEVGEFVSPQAPVVELVDASELRLELDVPERFSTQIREGQAVQVTVGGSTTPIEGTVRFVSAALDEARRTLTIEAVVPNPEGELRAGHFAHARIALDGTQELVRVPSDALGERAGVERLFVVEDGVARARIVTTVRRDGESALVSGEVHPNDAVVTDPPRELADGVPVRVGHAIAER